MLPCTVALYHQDPVVYGEVCHSVACSRCWGGIHWLDPIIKPCEHINTCVWEGKVFLLWIARVFLGCEPSTWLLFAVVHCIFPFTAVENTLSLITYTSQILWSSLCNISINCFDCEAVGDIRTVLRERLETFQAGHFSCPDSTETSYRAAATFLWISHCTAELHGAEQSLLLPV